VSDHPNFHHKEKGISQIGSFYECPYTIWSR